MKNIVEKDEVKCQSCGGNMVYSPQNRALICNNCKSLSQIETSVTFEKHDYSEDAEDKQGYSEWKSQNRIFKCSSCGASVVLSGLQISSTCPYCGANYATQERAVAGLRPDAIIPFKFSNEEASELFRQGVKKKAFLPNKLKKSPPIDSIKGIYIPCFSYDARTASKYDGKLETEHSHTDSNGHTHTTTSHEYISGTKAMQHANVLVETSSHIDQLTFNDIKPYNLRELVDYKNEFIMGYSVENYDQALSNCKKIADEIMDQKIREAILSRYSYDRVCYLNVTTKRSDEQYAYYLLPTYKFDCVYKEKTYTTYMNGQTGKVGRGLPKSVAKITSLVLFIVLWVVAIILAIIFLH